MKYIDADKIQAEIERRKKQELTFRERNILIDIEMAIDTLEEPDKDLPLPEDTLIYRKGVEEGRRLEREDMLKDAVEGTVYGNEDYTWVAGDIPSQFKYGDKVRIFILPKEDGQ